MVIFHIFSKKRNFLYKRVNSTDNYIGCCCPQNNGSW